MSLVVFLPIIFGFVAGLFHRVFISPFIGGLRPVIQSIGTPAAGVLASFIPVLVSFSALLHVMLKEKDNDTPETFVFFATLAAAYSYILVFLGYGAAVALSIAANFGGKKETKNPA